MIAWAIWLTDVFSIPIFAWIAIVAIESYPHIFQVCDLLDTNWVVLVTVLVVPGFLIVLCSVASIAINNSLSTNRRSIARRAGRRGRYWASMKVSFQFCVLGSYVASAVYLGISWSRADEVFQTKMYQYRAFLDSHKSVARLQLNMQCCGSFSYRDWFEIQQVPDEYLVIKRGIDKFDGRRINTTADEVPWSCCKHSTGRKCRASSLLHQV